VTTKTKTQAGDRREKLRQEYWPDEIAWDGKGRGWYPSPRTLPLILGLLASKDLSGNQDPSRVYVELLSRHMDEGFIEMTHEEDHAYAAGYWGERSARTWRERMEILEQIGFIKSKPKGNRKYGYVLLVHPAVAVQQLKEQGKLPSRWWDAYRARQIETRATSYDDLVPAETLTKTARAKMKTA
jgi:hypothetical protein